MHLSLRSNPVRRFATAERTIYFSALFLFVIQIIIGLTTFSATPFPSDTLGKINTAHKYLGYLLILSYPAVFVLWIREKNSDILHKILTICFLTVILSISVISLMIFRNDDMNFRLIANGIMHNTVFIASIMIIAGIWRIWKKRT